MSHLVPATKGRTAARMAELGIGTITYHYDGTAGPPTNAKGRLSKVTQAIDNPATPTRTEKLETEYTYLARGVVFRELRRVDVSHLASLATTQWIDRAYNALDPGGWTGCARPRSMTWRRSKPQLGSRFTSAGGDRSSIFRAGTRARPPRRAA